jgi:hypothetical protein
VRLIVAAALVGGCAYYVEGDVHGTTPLMVMNNSGTTIIGSKFWAPDRQEPIEYFSSDIQPGEWRKYTVKPGPVAIMFVGLGDYRMVDTRVQVSGPTELVVTAQPWGKPAAEGYAQFTVAPAAPPAEVAAPARDDDPEDCEKHGCPGESHCMPNTGPMNDRGWRPPRCQPW